MIRTTCSYGYQRGINRGYSQNTCRKLSTVKYPSYLYTVMDTYQSTNSAKGYYTTEREKSTASSSKGFPATRHNSGSVNTAILDGHVKTYSCGDNDPYNNAYMGNNYTNPRGWNGIDQNTL